ncbi:HypC/HybG/HupF family hydrogenase formation chaperone [Neptunomonas sp. XY-337]|uniref:HypC/HybG/HupF family hydrogenase formation chaperone n=1 Tax=Neptunomonas sp. XY-337 TaxID=2561897 RepID=UPI0010A99A4F|nr:HypC/HybG/HupF family hydrogenase formation chaperone [Neptunomonas sp. XY-337]
MCIGIPMQIQAVDELSARCTADATEQQVDLSLVGIQPVGTWVLVFLGAAREVISADRAQQVTQALDAMQQVAQGNTDGLDALFADLTNREPMLPEHLRKK